MTATIAPPRSFTAPASQDVGSFSVSSEYSLSEAAEILDMSEDCLNDLIKIGVFEYREENGKRFILQSRIHEFDEKQKRIEIGLNEIVRWDQEMGLYDD